MGQTGGLVKGSLLSPDVEPRPIPVLVEDGEWVPLHKVNGKWAISTELPNIRIGKMFYNENPVDDAKTWVIWRQTRRGMGWDGEHVASAEDDSWTVIGHLIQYGYYPLEFASKVLRYNR